VRLAELLGVLLGHGSHSDQVVELLPALAGASGQSST
jgi:hypothetical protein